MVDNEFGDNYISPELLGYITTQAQPAYTRLTVLDDETKNLIAQHVDFATYSYNAMFLKLEKKIVELEKQVTDLQTRLSNIENQQILVI